MCLALCPGEGERGCFYEHQIAEHLSDALGLETRPIIRRLQSEFAALEHSVGPGKLIQGTFSAGISMARPEVKTLKDWLQLAYGALQDGMNRGGNLTEIAGGEPRITVTR